MGIKCRLVPVLLLYNVGTILGPGPQERIQEAVGFPAVRLVPGPRSA